MKTFDEFLLKYGFNPDTNKVKCSFCDGKGSYKDMQDRDPIEGFKMVNSKPCHECNGEGAVHWQYIIEKYIDYVRIFIFNYPEKMKKKLMVDSIKNKLNENEKNFLSENGFSLDDC